MVKYLLSKRSDPNVRNKMNGFTPLHWAARYGEIDIVKALCESHEEVCEYIPDYKGFTPLDFAGKFNHTETVSYLIKRIWEKFRMS